MTRRRLWSYGSFAVIYLGWLVMSAPAPLIASYLREHGPSEGETIVRALTLQRERSLWHALDQMFKLGEVRAVPPNTGDTRGRLELVQ